MPIEATPDRFERAILAALHEEIGRVVEEECERAAAQVRTRIRASIGKIVMSALLNYEVERHGVDLVIKVRNAAGVDQDSTPS